MNLTSGIWLGLEPNLYYHVYDSYTSSKSRTNKRIAPQGVEKLFSGTSVSNRVETLNLGRYGRYDPINNRMSWLPMQSRGYFPPDPENPGHTTKILSAIKNQKLNLAQFVAEFPSTARMFQDFYRRVLATRRAAKSGDVFGILSALSGSKQLRGARIHMVRRVDHKRGKRATTSFLWTDSQRGKVGTEALRVPTRVLASNELAFTYGVKPLISDMKGALSEVLSGVRSRPQIFAVSATSVASTYLEGRLKRDTTWQINADSVFTRNFQKKERTKVWVEMSKPTWVNDASRLGFLNTLALGWEIIPYSFVVDWFLNVGDILQNLDALTGVRRIGVHRTIRVKNLYTTDCVPNGNRDVGGRYSGVYQTTSRGFATTLPPITLNWDPYMSFNRALSALSLARTRFR